MSLLKKKNYFHGREVEHSIRHQKPKGNLLSLMKQIGLSVLTPNMIDKNHNVTELNKHQHNLVAKNKKMTTNCGLKNWKRLKLMVSICHVVMLFDREVYLYCAKNIHSVRLAAYLSLWK